MIETILIVGACGQIGTELTLKLREIYGNNTVIALDIRETFHEDVKNSGPFEVGDALNSEYLKSIVDKYNVKEVYLMAAMLSATGEQFPEKAWELNMNTLFHVLDLAKNRYINKVFWPSSIAVFGPTTPKINTPQKTIMEPKTVYGISKQSGERWCEYYNNKYGVDVRSIRYPGIISWKVEPGGGTTDYAIEIFHQALKSKSYTCFLREESNLPMMYMDDAVRATIELMQSPKERIKEKSSYNLHAISFTPKKIADQIKKHIPDFTFFCQPDFRQAIADSWPQSIDDSRARDDWHWKHHFDLTRITEDMLFRLNKKYSIDSII